MDEATGISFTDLLGLSKPLTKLVEVCSSGMGMLYKPVHERRMIDAKAYEIRQIGEAIRENSDLPVNYQYRNIGINITDVEDLAQRAQVRLLYEEMKRQQNVEAVSDNAYNEVLGKETVSDTPVDEDWKTRFFNIAKDISSEEMQKIWGKILAGEVEQPGSFSIRTLDVIRNLSQKEASIFQKIIPFIVHANNDLFITNEDEIYGKYGVTFDELLVLDECGLISSAGMVSLTQTVERSPGLLIYTNERLLALDSAPSYPAKFAYGVHSLTNAGKELFRILECVPNEEYFYDLSEHIFNQKKRYNLRVYKVNNIEGKKVNYNKNVLREYVVKNKQN